MPVVLFKNKWKVDEDLIKELREKFLAEVEEEDPDLYHPDDIQRVKDNDWYVVRYILHQRQNVVNALKMMKDSLQWRKEFEINTLSRADLPIEFWNSRAAMIYSRDKHGYPLIIFRTKVHTKSESIKKMQQQYIIYFVEKAVRANDWGLVTVLFDCADTGLSNADLDMLRFVLNVFKKHYPWALAQFIVCNMPWYLSGIWKVMKPWIPEQYVSKVKFVDLDTLRDLVDPEQLPVALGGTCSKLYDPKDGVEEVPLDDEEVYTPPPQVVPC